VRFDTSSHAAAVIDSASHLAGPLRGGEIVVGGAGLSVVDTAFATMLHEVGRISGTATSTLSLRGQRAIWTGPLEPKEQPTGDNPAIEQDDYDRAVLLVPPALRGLAAVDLSQPPVPRAIRVLTELDGRLATEHVVVGSRLYVRAVPPPPGCRRGEACAPDLTIIGDVDAFAGNRSWRRGSTPLRVDQSAFGDDHAVWALSSRSTVVQYDVGDLLAVKPLVEYPHPWAATMVPLGGNQALLFNFSFDAEIGYLGETASKLSRVYRISVQVRDAAGAIATASRTVHLIPYDHAPTIGGVTQIQGGVAGEVFGFHVAAADQDSTQPWNPHLFARVDWNGDGVFDSDWHWLYRDDAGGFAVDLYQSFVVPGTYPAVFEVRDGYWARSQTVTLPITVLPAQP
jgi:hypothetical protein